MSQETRPTSPAIPCSSPRAILLPVLCPCLQHCLVSRPHPQLILPLKLSLSSAFVLCMSWALLPSSCELGVFLSLRVWPLMLSHMETDTG